MKGLIGGFMASAFVSVAPAADQNQQPQFTNPTQEAWRYLGKACYAQYGFDEHVDRIEKKYVIPTLGRETYVFMEKYGVYAGVAVRLATENRLSYTWEF